MGVGWYSDLCDSWAVTPERKIPELSSWQSWLKARKEAVAFIFPIHVLRQLGKESAVVEDHETWVSSGYQQNGTTSHLWKTGKELRYQTVERVDLLHR